MTIVSDVMTRDVRVAVPEMPIEAAARLMAELDAGALPVVDGGQLQGMVTDRDIVVRAVALGLTPDTPVADVMTPGVRYCREEDRLDEVLAGMGEHQVRRMPVLDRAGALVGILSLSDAVTAAAAPATAEAIEDISAPGGAHSQTDADDPHAVVAPTVETEGALGVRHFTDDEPG